MPGGDTRVRRVVVANVGGNGKVRETERAITDLVFLFTP